jgi:hypothetical protein
MINSRSTARGSSSVGRIALGGFQFPPIHGTKLNMIRPKRHLGPQARYVHALSLDGVGDHCEVDIPAI